MYIDHSSVIAYLTTFSWTFFAHATIYFYSLSINVFFLTCRSLLKKIYKIAPCYSLFFKALPHFQCGVILGWCIGSVSCSHYDAYLMHACGMWVVYCKGVGFPRDKMYLLGQWILILEAHCTRFSRQHQATLTQWSFWILERNGLLCRLYSIYSLPAPAEVAGTTHELIISKFS